MPDFNTRKHPGADRSWIVATWALGGFAAIMGQALYRLTPQAIETLGGPLEPAQQAAAAASILLFSIGKGYFVFHRKFAPRFALKLRGLVRVRPVAPVILAALYCMGLAPARRADVAAWLRSLAFTAGIVAMIIGLRQVDAPWRGIVASGVAVALALGTVTTLAQGIRTVVRATAAVRPALLPAALREAAGPRIPTADPLSTPQVERP